MQGNVEHFSISSNDSIWHENEQIAKRTNCDEPSMKKFNDFYSYEENYHKNASSPSDHCYTEQQQNNNNNNDEEDEESQCYFINSTTYENLDLDQQNPFNKYKNHIMEKYLRDCQKPENRFKKNDYDDKPSIISKWLESAANFKPSENNYLQWTFNKTLRKKIKKIEQIDYQQQQQQQHGREELDAAEALTKLANAYNSRKICAITTLTTTSHLSQI